MSLAPRVGIALPVFNGERFLEEAIRSILGQSYEDFHLLISDNASTDATEEICRSYADKDERVQYIRNRANFGYVFNFNNAFKLSSGEYFKWAAHDDVLAPEFLSRCVETLDADPSVVLAYGGTAGIDERGNPADLTWELSDKNSPESTFAPDPVTRFRRMMRHLWSIDSQFAGVVRSEALARTPLHGSHTGGDQVLISELSLHGRFYELPEKLFFLRVHPARGSKMSSARDRAAYSGTSTTAWAPFRLSKPISVYPKRAAGYLAAIRRSPLSAREKMLCYLEVGGAVLRWMKRPGHGGY